MSLFSRMDSLTLGTANSFSALQFFWQPSIHGRSSKILTFPHRKLRSNLVLASKDEPKLDEWDQMELKFGRMIGEDPKITLAKIMGRKSNPDLSYLEIEKLLDKRKGKASGEEIEDIPFDLSNETKSEISTQELNLVRPVPKKGIKFVAADKPLEADVDTSSRPESVPDEKRLTSTEGLRLLRPVPKKGINFEATNKMSEVYGENAARPLKRSTEESKSSVPNVILRKPSLFNEDNGGENRNKTSRFGMKPNLSLRMGKDMQKERFSDITLLKKPEPVTIRDEEKIHSDSCFEIGEEDKVVTFNKVGEQASSKELTESNFDQVVTEDKFGISKIETASGSNANQFQETGQIDSEVDKGFAGELQADMSSGEETFATDGSSGNINSMPIGSVLQEKPKRLDHPGKAADLKIQKEVVLNNPESLVNLSELENFLKTSPVKEQEEDYWTRAEKLVKTGEREEVELISSSSRGFVVSFGSLIGFLPYRNLGTRWKFLAFESWLRRKGLDPANYRQNLGIIGKYEASSMSYTTEPLVDPESDPKTDKEITPDMKPDDLLMIYDQEKLKFLSSFIGQKIKVNVVLADRNSRRIIVSIKPKEKEELIKKKRSLMARLSVGDVVKCCIKKITYFGVFVEVEGVPALIHQTEVSWDATLDPALHFKVGQIVDAKVHQLDFSLDRIYLSLKEITPDPLMETLEAVVGGHSSLDGRLEVAQADTEWPDVESLIKELQQFDGIQSVSKGWHFLSPGLAPTFQVYMASLFENQYKLLARAGNRVQEVIVQTSLSKDELKSAIMMCTNRVE